jgi:hypothetical protein
MTFDFSCDAIESERVHCWLRHRHLLT